MTIKTVALCAGWILANCLLGQTPGFQTSESFLNLVEPLITQEEKRIYEQLGSYAERDYFEAIFWFKRNPEPTKSGNPFKKAFFERRSQLLERFREGSTPAERTDRGRLFLLLGEPLEVVSSMENETYLEEWRYPEPTRPFRFLLDRGSRRFRLEADGETSFDNLSRSLILDRAESYRLNPSPLTLPNVGSTKDIENLVAEDREDFPLHVRYDFLQGDQSRTLILVTLTLPSPEPRPVEVNLTLFDPYQNKVVDFKQRTSFEPGVAKRFTVVAEGDFAEFVLRIRDNKGRLSVRRDRLDIPRLTLGGSGYSSLLAAEELQRIPLEGFHENRLFIYGDRYFSPRAWWPTPPAAAVLMQVVYGSKGLPDRVFVSGKRLEHPSFLATSQEGDATRWLLALPKNSLDASLPVARVEYEISPGLFRSFEYVFGAPPTEPPLGNAQVAWLEPSPATAERLSRIQLDSERPLLSVDLRLNGTLLYSRDQAPWRFSLDESLYSLSAANALAADLHGPDGSRRALLEVAPLRADQTIQSRAIQVFFNAYDEELQFIENLDLAKLRIAVDGQSQTPIELVRLEEPITYCFLVDVSASMKEAFFTNLDALKRFIENIRPIDRGFCVAFADNYSQLLQPTPYKGVLSAAAATLVPQTLNARTADAIFQENETFLFDAAIAAIHALNQYPGRKVMVIISDGIAVEGQFSRNALWNYAAENDVVIYSLWLDNNPQLSSEDESFLAKEMGKGERFARAIGLTRFFANKDHRKNLIGNKIRYGSIHEGTLKTLAEESGGFHYRIFRTDRNLIKTYVEDMASALGSQYRATLHLPVSDKRQELTVESLDEKVAIRCKSAIKVRKTNPLSE
jgi:VWFA-related protein